MEITLRRIVILALSMYPLLTFSQATPWPIKPIRIIVPNTAGGATDIVARQVMERISQQLGQPIIVEDRPGAGGTIGSSVVAHAEPDGYTLMVISNGHTLVPSLYRNLNYDPVKDFIGVIPLASVPMVLVMSPAKGIRNLQELVKSAKANPGSLNYASSGGATQLGAERLRLAAGYTGTHIPFKGSPEALTDVMAGRVDFYYSPIGLAKPFFASDKLIPIAVSSARRSSGLPDVPTSIEAGLPKSDYEVWIGLFAPAKTPPAIIARLHAETAKALRNPEIRDKFSAMVLDGMSMSSAEFELFLKKDFELNGELAKAAGIAVN